MASEYGFSVALEVAAHSNFLLRIGDVHLLQPAHIDHLLLTPIGLPPVTGKILFSSKVRLPIPLAAAVNALTAVDVATVLDCVVMAYRGLIVQASAHVASRACVPCLLRATWL